MLPRSRPIDNETRGIFDRRLVVVSRDVPHYDLVPLFYLLAAKLSVSQRGPTHMGDGGLPTDHLGNEAVDQSVVVAQHAALVRMFAECQNRAGHSVAGGIVSGNDQQNDIAE